MCACFYLRWSQGMHPSPLVIRLYTFAEADGRYTCSTLMPYRSNLADLHQFQNYPSFPVIPTIHSNKDRARAVTKTTGELPILAISVLITVARVCDCE